MTMLSRGKRGHFLCRVFGIAHFRIRASLVVGGGWWSIAPDGAATANQEHAYTFDDNSFRGSATVTATDRAENPGTVAFTVARDGVPPTFSLDPAVENGVIHVTWSASDAASSIDTSTCALEVREDNGAWQPFSTMCAGDEIHSEAQPGHVYTFRLSASDNVGNAASAEAQAIVPRVTKYYYHPSTGSGQAGGQRVAMRVDEAGGDRVYYLHGDHLGSTSLTTDENGDVVARQLYYPYGEPRWQEGAFPTDFGFGGQRHDGTGLIFMHARYYHPYLGRFISADTIVPDPGNPQDLNRYAYVRNNPLKYIDPTGYYSEDEIMQAFDASTWDQILEQFRQGGTLEGRWGWLEILRRAEDGYMVTGDDLVPTDSSAANQILILHCSTRSTRFKDLADQDASVHTPNFRYEQTGSTSIPTSASDLIGMQPRKI